MTKESAIKLAYFTFNQNAMDFRGKEGNVFIWTDNYAAVIEISDHPSPDIGAAVNKEDWGKAVKGDITETVKEDLASDDIVGFVTDSEKVNNYLAKSGTFIKKDGEVRQYRSGDNVFEVYS